MLTVRLVCLQPPYKVELNNPKKTILVEVMKATAAISVVEDYKLLGKLNLRELSMIGDDAQDKTADSKQAAAALNGVSVAAKPAETAASLKAASNEASAPSEAAATEASASVPYVSTTTAADAKDT